jgi:DNA processing protein
MARRPKKVLQKGELFHFTEEGKLHWLRLLRTENIGPITFYHLLNRFGTAEEALKRLPDIAHRAGRKVPLQIPSLKDIMKEYESYQAMGIQLIARPDPDYPEILGKISDAPPLLSVMGRVELLRKPIFGIVGARNASAVGRQMAEDYAEKLGKEGMVIVSGLARGIDTHAHKGSLATGAIAVLPGGVDQVYPPENKVLYKALSEEGLLISEAPLGIAPQANLFPRRNRLISGLSWGILVVEAALKSGSLITAHLAADQGREVFAIPGSPMDPRSRGTNELIRQGAILVQSTEDILEEYQKHRYASLAEEEEGYHAGEADSEAISDSELEKARQEIWRALNQVPVTLEDLCQVLHLPIGITRVAIIEMDVAGFIDWHPGGKISLTSQALCAQG